jgi:hypothetical protein
MLLMRVVTSTNGQKTAPGSRFGKLSCNNLMKSAKRNGRIHCVPQKRGRPKNPPKDWVADKTYDSRKFRRYLWGWEIKPIIPAKEEKESKTLAIDSKVTFVSRTLESGCVEL